MTFAADIADDFATVVDGLEAVTLQTSDEVAWESMTVNEWAELTVDEWDAMLVADPQTAIAKALQRALTTIELAQSEGKYRAGDTVWHFPFSEVSTAPVPGDKIIDASLERWTVLSASEQTLSARFRCVCRNLSISEDLNTLIDIQNATYTKGEGGAQTRTWSAFRTDVRAKIAEQEEDATTEHDNRYILKRVIIYTEDLFAIDNNYRVVAADGSIYNVTAFAAPEAIDVLPEIHAVLNKWPSG